MGEGPQLPRTQTISSLDGIAKSCSNTIADRPGDIQPRHLVVVLSHCTAAGCALRWVFLLLSSPRVSTDTATPRTLPCCACGLPRCAEVVTTRLVLPLFSSVLYIHIYLYIYIYIHIHTTPGFVCLRLPYLHWLLVPGIRLAENTPSRRRPCLCNTNGRTSRAPISLCPLSGLRAGQRTLVWCVPCSFFFSVPSESSKCFISIRAPTLANPVNFSLLSPCLQPRRGPPTARYHASLHDGSEHHNRSPALNGCVPS